MKNFSEINKAELYGALVWLVSATFMLTYALLFTLGYNLPGVEQVVSFVDRIPVEYIYIAAFLAIFIEGLYVVGVFFPGTTFVAIFVVVAQVGGWIEFAITIFAIFFGWVVSGFVNIGFAYFLRRSGKEVHEEPQVVQDNALLTWLPVFRANYEVAQILEGGSVWRVLFSSIRVRLYASLFATVLLGVGGLYVDIRDISNGEGFTTLAVVGAIVFIVGLLKLRGALLPKQQSI